MDEGSREEHLHILQVVRKSGVEANWRSYLASGEKCPIALLLKLAKGNDSTVRGSAAGNAALSMKALLALSLDSDDLVQIGATSCELLRPRTVLRLRNVSGVG